MAAKILKLIRRLPRQSRNCGIYLVGRVVVRAWHAAALCMLFIAVAHAASGGVQGVVADPIPLISVCGSGHPLQQANLPDTVAQALNLQPQLLIAEANALAARAELHAAKGEFLPQLDLSAVEEQFVPSNGNTPVVVVGNSVLGGPRVKSAYASLGLKWNLWNNGQDMAALHGAQAGVRSALYGVDSQFGDTLLGVLKAYADLYEAEVSARNDAQAAASLTAIQAQAEQRYAHGEGTEVAVGQARVAALNAQQTLNAACRDLDGKSAALAQAAGIEMKSALSLRTLAPLPQPESTGGARTLQNLVDETSAVEEARQKVLAAESALRRAHGEYGPTVALSLQKDYLGQDPNGFGAANKNVAAEDYRVGLQISQPLFPFNSQNADVDKARAQLIKAQASYREARIEAQTSILAAMSARRDAERSFDAAQSSLTDAEHVLALTQAQFHAGRLDSDSVAHAIMDRDAAQADVAKLASQLALAEWEAERTQLPQQFAITLLHQLNLQVQLPSDDAGG